MANIKVVVVVVVVVMLQVLLGKGSAIVHTANNVCTVSYI